MGYKTKGLFDAFYAYDKKKKIVCYQINFPYNLMPKITFMILLLRFNR